MKRPLFCVAVAYALGEVVCLYTKTVAERSIVSVMLLCCVLFSVIKTKKWKCACFTVLAFSVGMGRAFFCIPEDVRMQVYAENGFLMTEEEDYNLYVFGGDGAGGKSAVVSGMIIGKQGGDIPILRVYESSWEGVKKGDAILLRGDIDSHSISAYVSASGICYPFSFAANPGGFCTRVYYMARNIDAYMYVEKSQNIENESVGKRTLYQKLSCSYYRVKEHLYQFRTAFKSRFYRLLPEDTASLYTGILLGDKTGIDLDIKKRYQVGGIAHILAISGVNTLSLAYIIICKTAILRHF